MRFVRGVSRLGMPGNAANYQRAQARASVGWIIAQQLSVRATETLVARMVSEKSASSSSRRNGTDEMDYANQLLSEVLHTSVSIKPRQKGGGRIVIDYANPEDLERLIDYIRSK